MPYSIPSSIKILFLATAPFLFVLLGILCLSSMVPRVYIYFTVPLQRRVALFFVRAQMCTLSSIFSKKIWIFGCHYIKLWQGHCWIEKNTRNLTVFMVLVIWPSSFLKFPFVFGFISGLWLYDKTTKMTLHHLSRLSMPMNKKTECKDD